MSIIFIKTLRILSYSTLWWQLNYLLMITEFTAAEAIDYINRDCLIVCSFISGIIMHGNNLT